MRTILFLFSLLFENIKEIYNTKTKCYPYKAQPTHDQLGQDKVHVDISQKA